MTTPSDYAAAFRCAARQLYDGRDYPEAERFVLEKERRSAMGIDLKAFKAANESINFSSLMTEKNLLSFVMAYEAARAPNIDGLTIRLVAALERCRDFQIDDEIDRVVLPVLEQAYQYLKGGDK